MSRIEDENDLSDIDGILSASKVTHVTDYQFLKALEKCGRAFLNSSKRPAAITVRKAAAQTMIDYFGETFDITYTENQIFKKFYNMKQRLRSRINKRDPLTNSDQLLKKLLDEEDLNSE